jgi:hypothetical protein
MNKLPATRPLYSRIAELLHDARLNVVRTVNQTMVYTYYEIGRMIIEDEQKGEERAEYGKKILNELSARLTAEFGKGFSKRNLEQMRKFFLTYSIAQKSSAQLQTRENLHDTSIDDRSLKSIAPENTKNRPTFTLSWSHYLKLMRIENPEERRFYEIECAVNNWSLKELQRQFDSALYERLALSREKDGVKQLAKKGQIIEKPADMLKDPYILEFLNLPDNQRYSESDFETAII